MPFNFPQPTTEQAKAIASEIEAKSGSAAPAKAEGLFSYFRNRFNYGFGEGLDQGYFLRWPHEIKEEWECIEAATYVYAVAEALGLEPRMMHVQQWMGIDTAHETVDVLVDGQRFLVDPLNRMFGRVSYEATGITVADNTITERCVLPSGRLMEVPKWELLARIDYYRSDEGILNLLRCGQRYSIAPAIDGFIWLNAKERQMECRFQRCLPFAPASYWKMTSSLHDGPDYQESGFCRGFHWIEIAEKEPVCRSTGETWELLALRKKGRMHLFNLLLYELLYEEAYGKCPEREDEQRKLLFEDGDLPIKNLEQKMASLKQDGLKPEVKHHYYELQYAKEKLHDFERTALDIITLKLKIEEEAKTMGSQPLSVYQRKLEERDYHLPDILDQLRAHWVSQFYESPPIQDEKNKRRLSAVETVVNRCLDRGLL